MKFYGESRKKTAYCQAAGSVQNVKINQEGKEEFELLRQISLEKSKKKFQTQDGDEFIAGMSNIIAILPNPEKQNGIDGRVNRLFEKVRHVLEMK